MGIIIDFNLFEANKSGDLSSITKGVITTTSVGYLSHLALDSQIPFGLVLIA